MGRYTELPGLLVAEPGEDCSERVGSLLGAEAALSLLPGRVSMRTIGGGG